MERSKALQRKAEQSPKREDFVREFGAKSVKDEADGSWTCTVKSREDIKRAYQMQEGSRRIEVEIGAREQARWDGKREKVVRRDGRVLDFPAELVDQVKHKVRPAGRNGLAPAEHFSMSQAFGSYEQGPDGLWFVWNGGWEPTHLWRKGAASPQRDPDGNVWIEVDEEWLLQGEEAEWPKKPEP